MQAEKRSKAESPAAIENTSIADSGDEGLSIEDLALPRTVIARVSKRVLPPNAQIQKQALQAISKSATAFVNYISSHANENAGRANKKTIRPEDVIEAAKELEFGAFVPQLQAALQGYNDIQSEKLKQRRNKAPQPEGIPAGTQGGSTVAQATAGAKKKVRDDSPPAMKRARRSSADGGRAGISSDDEGSLSEEDDRAGQNEEDEQDDDDEEEAENINASSEHSENGEDELQEDPVEEKNDEDDGDRDEVLDGHESD